MSDGAFDMTALIVVVVVSIVGGAVSAWAFVVLAEIGENVSAIAKTLQAREEEEKEEP